MPTIAVGNASLTATRYSPSWQGFADGQGPVIGVLDSGLALSIQAHSALESSGSILSIQLPLFTVDSEYSDAAIALPLLEVDSTGFVGITTSIWQEPIPLPLFTVASAGSVGIAGDISLSLPLFAVDAASDAAVVQLELPLFTVDSSGLVENLAVGSVTLPLFDVSAEETPSAHGVFDLPLFSIDGTLLLENRGDIELSLKLFAVAAEGATGRVGSATIELPLFAVDADGYSELVGTSVLELPMLVVEATGFDTAVAPTLSGWVLNTETNALTKYENFPFNSFAKFRDAYIGASSTGLYVLTGSSDAGQPIAAHILSGINDFDTGMQKRMRAAYIRQKADGHMSLRVITEDNNGTEYRVPYNGATKMNTSRVGLLEGVNGVYWQFEYSNVNGSDFELDELELLPAVLSRRVG